MNTRAPPQVSESASKGLCTAKRSPDCAAASGTTASAYAA
nr:MAG TPA_asm: hypothetical protein [Caudoviricetes sp.]